MTFRSYKNKTQTSSTQPLAKKMYFIFVRDKAMKLTFVSLTSVCIRFSSHLCHAFIRQCFPEVTAENSSHGHKLTVCTGHFLS